MHWSSVRLIKGSFTASCRLAERRPALPSLPRRAFLLVVPALFQGVYPSSRAHSASRSMAPKQASPGLVPDVVDRIEPSGIKLDVAYGSHKVHDAVNLTPAQASSEPHVTLHGADTSALYTLVCTDPDPPDPANPIYREYLHWIVTNIPGKEATAKAGTQVVSYTGPAPPIGSHRYGFLLFKQPGQGPLQAKDPTAGKRKHFKTRGFAEEHSLGTPIAATYFLSHKS